MKKMMMFLMVSMFFFVGGMTEGIAKEKVKNVKRESKKYVITTPTSILVSPGVIVNISFYIYGLTEKNNYSIGVYYKTQEGNMKLLLTIDSQGNWVRVPNVSDRIAASYYAVGYCGVITIYNTCSEDSGEYYVMVRGKDFVAFVSGGTLLTVRKQFE